MKIKRNITINIDWLSIILYLMLVFAGFLNIYSAVFNEDSRTIFDLNQKYGKQLIWILISLIIAFMILVIDSRFFSYFAYIIYGFFILLLILVLIFGKEFHGSRSWFTIGNFLFQPSEFSKFATALAISKYLSDHFKGHRDFRPGYNMYIIIFLPALLIVFQNDLGSALVYSVFILVLFRAGLPGKYLVYIMFFIALFFVSLLIDSIYLIPALIIIFFIRYSYIIKKIKEPLKVFAVLAGFTLLCFSVNEILKLNIQIMEIFLYSITFGMISFVFFYRRKKINITAKILIPLIISLCFSFSVEYIYNNILEPYHRQRIDNIMGVSVDPLGAGYNINQSKIAIGSGGFAGKGFLKGTQTKYDFVPEQSTDFIFCTVGEEWGFIGSTVIIVLFGLLLFRLIILAERQRSIFSMIYGYCVASILLFHFVINISMTLGLFPVIGIPLPFFSYGGSSLIAFTILLFIFIRFNTERFNVIV